MQEMDDKGEENNKEEFYQTEISLLRRIIKELKEKNSILIENSALLREKVKYLEKELLTSKTNTIPAKTSINNNTEVRNSSNLREMDRTVSKNIPVSQNMNQNTKQVGNNIVNDKISGNMQSFSKVVQKNNDKTHELEKKQKSVMENLININNLNKADNVSNENNFQTVSYKRKQKTNKHLIHGSGTNITSLTAAPKLGHIHVCGLHPEVTDIMVQNHLKHNDIANATCEKLNSKHPTEYASYKISFPIDFLEKVKNPSMWPQGVKVNKFFHNIQRKETLT